MFRISKTLKNYKSELFIGKCLTVAISQNKLSSVWISKDNYELENESGADMQQVWPILNVFNYFCISSLIYVV